MKKTTLYTIFICLWHSFIFSQSVNEKINYSEKIPIDSSVKIGKLKNGLTYYIKQNKQPANNVELRLVVNAGSILEDDNQSGLAHFMEHMNFNGTKHFKKNEMFDYLQSIGVKFGAHLNASTDFDETTYVLPIPSNDEVKLDKGFQILQDWASGALLNDKDIDDERGVVLEEQRLSENANFKMAKDYFPKLMYGSKYPERFPIGKKNNLKTFEHQNLRRFYKEWYRPDLIAIIAVGDIDVKQIEQKIKSYFEKIPERKKSRERKIATLKNHKQTLIAIESDKEASSSNVRIVYKDFKNYTPNVTIQDFKNSLPSFLINIMMSFRLYELANETSPPFINGNSYRGHLVRSKQANNLEVITNPNEQLKGLKSLLYEVERVKRFGFSQNELNAAKKHITAQLTQNYKDRNKRLSNSFVEEYISNFLKQEPIPNPDWLYKTSALLLSSIKLKEVNKITPTFFHDENRVVIITGPKKSVTELDVLNTLNSIKNQDISIYKDSSFSASLLTHTPKPGKIIKTTKNSELGTTKLTLSNGATVVYKKTDFKNGEIIFNAISSGGTSQYTDTELKATFLINNALTGAGINGHSTAELNKLLIGKNVSVSPFIGDYFEGFNGGSSPENLESLFKLTYLYFTSLNKNQEYFQEYINKQKKLSKNHLDNPLNYFKQEMDNFINSGNTRHFGFPTPKMYNLVNYDLAYQKYKERFSNANDFNFYFVGNVDENKLKEYVTKYLANLPSTNTKESYEVSKFRPLSGSHIKKVNKGKNQKSVVNIQYQGSVPNYNDNESLAFNALSEIIDVILNEKLREQESGIYTSSINANISNIPYNWYNLSITFPCAPENVKRLKNITVKEIDNIVKNGITEKNLNKAKKALITIFKKNLNTNNLWIQAITQIDFHKVKASNFLFYEKRVNSITKDDIQKVAKKYLTNGYILGVLNPEK